MTALEASDPRIDSVTRLTQRLKWALQDRFHDIWVSGEISNLSQAQSGHVYLTLADDNAQLRTVIWRTQAEQVDFELADGMQVICRGEIDIYPPRGTYQLIVRHIEPAGLGALQLALKKLHARLEAEGLFAPERKRSLPRIPRRVAVVTSPAGAAIQDFLKVVTRRWPALEILVIPARVQGAGAAREIAQGIVVAGLLQDRPDVVVVTRGGGSAEDLWCFNEELVVRAIAECPIPVISGVGHEIDVSLSDLVADVRALTPSEAAELLVPDRQDMIRLLNASQQRMQNSLRSTLARARERLTAIRSRRVFQAPEDLLNVARRRVDDLGTRLENRMSRSLEQHAARFSLMAQRLEAVSPLAVLGRGYSVTQTEDGQTLRDVANLQIGQTIVTQLARGKIESNVTGVNEAISANPSTESTSD